jgi:cytidine deaminase
MNAKTRKLIAAAVAAQKSAYCPYSRYAVGASVLTKSGKIFAGCNVENASYGLSLCAERVAIFKAVSERQHAFAAVCIVGLAAKPCGACRQVMFEFARPSTTVYLVDWNPEKGSRAIKRTTLGRLLPEAFDPLASGLLGAARRK